jgi:flavin-binding protein dodecin
MAENNVYKKIEVVGASKKSLTDAIKVAVARAAETVKNMSWFEVVEQRGAIREGKVAEYQVTVKIGFRVDEGPLKE